MQAPRIPDAIKRMFTETFSARDVAEPLASFDASAASRDVRDFMDARGYDVVGYVEKAALVDNSCGQYVQPLEMATS
jgi:hypothetical protein